MWTALHVDAAYKFSESQFRGIALLCVFHGDDALRTKAPFRTLEQEVLSVGCEVRMLLMRSSTVRSSRDVISGILNCVCPECGGRMGERGQEFRCQGECLTDWRQAWEQSSAESGPRSKRAAGRI
jgi:hypothetical protein